MDREIKVTKYGKIEGCVFDDRVSIELSPYDLGRLKHIFEKRALNAKSYSNQTEEREMYGVFAKAYEIWDECKKERKEV